MDGGTERLDCAACRITWYRLRGGSAVCPGCGAELTPLRTLFVALEIVGPTDSEDAPPVDAGQRSRPSA